MKTKKQKTPRKEGTAIIDVAIDRAFRIISMSSGKTCMAYLHDVEEIGIYIEKLESERKKKNKKKGKGARASRGTRQEGYIVPRG